MAEKYDKNGYNSSDFKRNANQDANEDMDQDGEGAKLNEKAADYLRELLGEKIKIDQGKFPVSTRLLDQEVSKLQASGRIPGKDNKYVDVYREKPTKVVAKVVLPIKEHPKFNFVGKLLGPKGNTMKQLQEETMCKMAVLGRGSMRDRQKEEELRNSLDPKYAHLADDLHVEISALAPPAEAHARIAYALAEVKKYIIPDAGDMGMMQHRQPPMRDMMMDSRGPPRRAPPPRMPPSMPPRPMAKTKVISILDRARNAMDNNYGYEDYGAPEPPVRGQPRVAQEPEYYGYETAHGPRYYEDDYYKDEAPAPREYKTTSRDVGTRRTAPAHAGHAGHGGHAAHAPRQHFQRASPYTRPSK